MQQQADDFPESNEIDQALILHLHRLFSGAEDVLVYDDGLVEVQNNPAYFLKIYFREPEQMALGTYFCISCGPGDYISSHLSKKVLDGFERRLNHTSNVLTFTTTVDDTALNAFFEETRQDNARKLEIYSKLCENIITFLRAL